MEKNKNTISSGKTDITFDTPLNPTISLGVDKDMYNPSGKDYLDGDSVNEHHIIEQANEYLAEEEFKQQYNNL